VDLEQMAQLEAMMRRPVGEVRAPARRLVRRLRGQVKWVAEIASPFGQVNNRARELSSSVAAGLRYEAWVEKELEKTERRLGSSCRWQRGPWLAFEDDEGEGVCQPDFVCEERRMVVAAKLSGPTQEAFDQLSLYRGVLGAWWEPGVQQFGDGFGGGGLVRGCLCVRSWRGPLRECFADLEGLLRSLPLGRPRANGYEFVLTG